MWDHTERVNLPWIAVAKYVQPQYIPIPIGVRQQFYVDVSSEATAAMALRELLPGDVAPQALVWIHLVGHMSRSVC